MEERSILLYSEEDRQTSFNSYTGSEKKMVMLVDSSFPGMKGVVVDSTSSPVAGVSVTGGWSAGDAGSVSCTTDAFGQCAVASGTLSRKVAAVTFSVTALGSDGLSYDAGANTDPDGDSDGTSIELTKP